MTRDHKAIYAARNDAARAQGYRSYSHRRRALATGIGLRGVDRNHRAIYTRRNTRAIAAGFRSYAHQRAWRASLAAVGA